MKVLPSQIYLSSSKSTPKCCKFFHHVGEMEHESIFQKGLTFSVNLACKFSPKQAMLGSHYLHCTPFNENSFAHNLSRKFMPYYHLSCTCLVNWTKITCSDFKRPSVLLLGSARCIISHVHITMGLL